MICTIYCDASYNPSTKIGAVGFRARFRNETLVGSIALPCLHLITDQGSRNTNVNEIEMFAILFAIRACKQNGWDPGVWFINSDNKYVCYHFWPWMQCKKGTRLMRTYNQILKLTRGKQIRVKHVYAHQNEVGNVRYWSNNTVDVIAKQARRNYENGVR
jgi:ribonuclease HI